jgi:hypothetical protein
VEAWRNASSSQDRTGIETYLRDFPEGLFADFARTRLQSFDQTVSATIGPSSDIVLASADPLRVQDALSVLGYLPQTRAVEPSEPDLIAAFDAYRARLPKPDAANLDQLFDDAATLSTFMAAATSQRIRTDMVALSSVEKTLDVALGAFAELKEIAGDSAEAKPILEEAEGNINAIRAARESILTRLDESRSYYHSLVTTAKESFAAFVTTDAMGKTGDATRDVAGVSPKLAQDARLFVKNVQLAGERPRGSFAWLTEFVTMGTE